MTTTQLHFQLDSELGDCREGEGDVDSAGEFDQAYERARDQLEAELGCCPKCSPKNLLCLIDKSSKHRVVTVEMVGTWVLTLVSSPSFFTIISQGFLS